MQSFRDGDKLTGSLRWLPGVILLVVGMMGCENSMSSPAPPSSQSDVHVNTGPLRDPAERHGLHVDVQPNPDGAPGVHVDVERPPVRTPPVENP
jgi:hypothetical protein